MAPVAGRPFLAWLLDPLAGFEVTIATGYAAGVVESAIGDRVRYSRETTPLGTGGALKLAGTGGFVLNGDSYCRVSFDAFEHFARGGPALVLTHSGLADSRMWDAQFWTFAEHYRVIGSGREQGKCDPAGLDWRRC